MAHTANSKSKPNVRNRANEAKNELAHDGRRMQQHARELADDVRETVHDTREHATRIAQDSYDLARETAATYLDRGRQRAQALEQNVEAYVAERPFRSVLIAAGVGFLAGMIFLRR